MPRFERIKFEPTQWARTLSGFDDAIVYQSSAYLSFLADTQKGEIVVAELKEGSETLGYFSGLLIRRFGVKILGSPFRAWTCPYMGFNLRSGVPRRAAVEALPGFAFKELKCLHLEVVDSYLTPEDAANLDFTTEARDTYVVDLTPSEEQVLAKMNSFRRRDIRRAEKHGIIIEEAKDSGIADDYSSQLGEVFGKQGLLPTFGVERVRALLEHLAPTGTLLALRARHPDGRCMATALFTGFQGKAFYWGGASWREFQKLCPNELLQWHAMRYWKARGMKTYNLVGTMEFKARFGGEPTTMTMISKSRNRFIGHLRSKAPVLLKAGLRLGWKLKNIGKRKAPAPPETGS
jgi:CelD/BcsL family acetyltransferase involved in cellulose biosynthesis